MYLCDVGNTNATLNHNGKIWSMPISQFRYFDSKEKIYYINVNMDLAKDLTLKPNFVDLEPYFKFDTIYKGIGIDRVAACYSVSDGMVIDAGSAIKVDIMSNNVHLGGFILPGISAYLKAYNNISPRLHVTLKSNVDLEVLPQDTTSAVSYGIIKSILLTIEDNCKDKKIFLTGGDGAYFSRFLPRSIYKQGLIFDGMIKVIKDEKLEEN